MLGKRIITSIMEDNKKTKKKVLAEDESLLDFQQLWVLFKSNWKWFPISIVACLLIASLYLWFMPTTVSVTGKMQIIDKSQKNSAMSAGMAMLNNLPLGLGTGLGGSVSLGIDSEREILMSNTLVRSVVKDLSLHTEYRLSKWGKKTLLYQNNPIIVTLDDPHLQWLDTELPLTFHQIQLTISKTASCYEVETTLVENKDETDLPSQTFATLPATIKTDFGVLTLTENKLTPKQAKVYEKGYTLKVTITPCITATDAFISRIKVEPPSKKVMNILSITLQDENVIRGIDFVNHLVDAYNQRANDEKNEEARKTDEFVNARLAKIDAELGSSDAAWEKSKKNFQVTDPSVDAQEVMTKKSEYESQLVSFGTQIQLQDYLNEYIDNPANLFELIPVNVGVYGGDALPMVSQHNMLVTQRREMLKSMSETSPQVQRLTQSIRELQPNIQIAMKRDRQTLLIKRQAVEREYNRYMGRVTSAPQQERVLTEIGRQREIKQGVYLLLLQKREEITMELATTTDKGMLIDETSMDKGSNKPQKKIVLLVTLFLGAILPMGVLYLFQMFKTKIDILDELKALTRLPILGEISSSNSDDAIRNLRTNLFLHLQPGQKTILIASQSTGDGKSFLATHLVESLSAIGKKTLYLDCDFRQMSSSAQKLYSSVLLSEKVHPADVLASNGFAEFIKKLKEDYDYIILDSPSISSYADAYQLATFADTTIYVVKSGRTQKSVIESLNKDTVFKNLFFCLFV